MLRNPLRRQSEYIGSHAVERLAPEGAACGGCDRTGSGESSSVTDVMLRALVQCSICEIWFCTPHFTMHTAPTGWDAPKPPWWRRALKAVRRHA